MNRGLKWGPNATCSDVCVADSYCIENVDECSNSSGTDKNPELNPSQSPNDSIVPKTSMNLF